jgi:hypothetical protein
LTPQIEGIYCEPTTSTIINGESEDEVNLVEDILIKRTSDPLTIDFGVYVSGPNGHDCVLGGPAVFTEDKKFTYSEGPGEKDCRVIIQISDSYISLDNNRYCSEYCGARASLNSSFRRENRIPFSSTSSKEVSCPI